MFSLGRVNSPKDVLLFFEKFFLKSLNTFNPNKNRSWYFKTPCISILCFLKGYNCMSSQIVNLSFFETIDEIKLTRSIISDCIKLSFVTPVKPLAQNLAGVMLLCVIEASNQYEPCFDSSAS